jgi:hypothetical protein
LPRILLISLLALLLLVPATAEGSSSVRLRGTVTAKDTGAHLVSVKSTRQLFSLRVPGSLAKIRSGQRVELRGTTLRAHGQGSRVLASGVTVASSQPLQAAPAPKPSIDDDDEATDDEREITGALTSFSPVTVASSTRTVSCAAPAGMSLTGFAIGDRVEMTCDLIGGTWVVRKLHLEDDEDGGDDDDDRRGHDGDEDDDDDSSGPGSGDDDEDDD